MFGLCSKIGVAKTSSLMISISHFNSQFVVPHGLKILPNMDPEICYLAVKLKKVVDNTCTIWDTPYIKNSPK